MAVKSTGGLPSEGGLLNIDKPAGWTSHDVVAKFRSLLNVRRIGHTGTLDPMATGVLLLCVGATTKMARFLVGLEKEYLGTMRLGAESDTLDGQGRISRGSEPLSPTDVEIREVFQRFTGKLRQIPPMYSAVKHRGQPLHRLARQGRSVPRKSRTVFIRSLDLVDHRPPRVTFRVVCTSGTYVRVLAADMGRQLGTGAYLETLRRLRVGPFRVEDALTVDGAIDLARSGELMKQLRPVMSGLMRFPRLVVHPWAVDAVLHGRPVTTEMVRELDPAATRGSEARVENTEKRLLAMLRLEIGADEWNDVAAEKSIGTYLRVLN
jgi:tRNA pseudouridine55 synthase